MVVSEIHMYTMCLKYGILYCISHWNSDILGIIMEKPFYEIVVHHDQIENYNQVLQRCILPVFIILLDLKVACLLSDNPRNIGWIKRIWYLMTTVIATRREFYCVILYLNWLQMFQKIFYCNFCYIKNSFKLYCYNVIWSYNCYMLINLTVA